MSDIIIRAARPDDRASLVDLMWELNRYEDAFGGDRDTTRAGAERCHADDERAVAEKGGAILVACRDGAVVGFLVLAIEVAPVFVREEIRRHGYVRALAVAEGARGAGIGRALLADAEQMVRAAGLPHIGLGALAGNVQARSLYERLGFVPHAIEFLKPLDDGAR